jgi:magnesium-transporting ATPase (P-type)
VICICICSCRIPADIRIIDNYDLKVECSSLTGESDLVAASVDKKHDIPAEARNLVFMSSLAMNGEARGIVMRTGKRQAVLGGGGCGGPGDVAMREREGCAR